MGRKKEDALDFAIEQVNQVLSCITESKTKSWSDLWNVAYRFCLKDFAHAKDVSDEWGVAPVFLLVAALLYVEHPLLVGQGRSWKYSLVGAQAEILKAVLHRWDLAIPINSTNSINMGVERMGESVERMRD